MQNVHILLLGYFFVASKGVQGLFEGLQIYLGVPEYFIYEHQFSWAVTILPVARLCNRETRIRGFFVLLRFMSF